MKDIAEGLDKMGLKKHTRLCMKDAGSLADLKMYGNHNVEV